MHDRQCYGPDANTEEGTLFEKLAGELLLEESYAFFFPYSFGMVFHKTTVSNAIFLNILDIFKIYCNQCKKTKSFYRSEIPPKDTDRNANNKDPDQTAPLRSGSLPLTRCHPKTYKNYCILAYVRILTKYMHTEQHKNVLNPVVFGYGQMETQ